MARPDERFLAGHGGRGQVGVSASNRWSGAGELGWEAGRNMDPWGYSGQALAQFRISGFTYQPLTEAPELRGAP